MLRPFAACSPARFERSTVEAAGRNVHEEAVDEPGSVEDHGSQSIAGFGPVVEEDALVVERDEPRVRDCHAVRCSGREARGRGVDGALDGKGREIA